MCILHFSSDFKTSLYIFVCQFCFAHFFIFKIIQFSMMNIAPNLNLWYESLQIKFCFCIVNDILVYLEKFSFQVIIVENNKAHFSD